LECIPYSLACKKENIVSDKGAEIPRRAQHLNRKIGSFLVVMNGSKIFA